MDAKKSPLALLAQTCSSIGKDTGPSKPIIPPIEKKDKEAYKEREGRKTESPSAKSTTSDGRKSLNPGDSRRDGISPGSKDGGSKSSFRTPPPKDIPPLVPISKSSDSSRKSPTSTSDLSKPSSSSPSTSSAPSASGLHSSNSRISVNCGNLSLEVNHQESASHALTKSSLPPSLQSVAGSLKPGEGLGHGLLPPSYAGLPLLGHHLPVDASAAHYPSLAHSALSSLSAQHHHKHGISPYVRYTTVKTAAGATTLVPVCSDPYCTHCKLTLSSAQLTPSVAGGACGAGCTQCTHDKSLPPSSLALAGLHGLPGLSPSALPGLYPHFGVLPGHHGLPYICNWVAGSDYCGKRFSSSEELLQHLRSHTSSSDAAAAAAAAAAAGLPVGFPYSSFGLSASALAAVSGHTPGSLSPNSALRQAYPRSLSPNSLLAAARYHPYGKSPLSASSLPTSGASLVGLPPSLGAYYPYAALYGQRLGAVAP